MKKSRANKQSKIKRLSIFTKEKSNMRPCTDRRRRSGAQTSGTDVKRSRTGRRSVRVPVASECHGAFPARGSSG